MSDSKCLYYTYSISSLILSFVLFNEDGKTPQSQQIFNKRGAVGTMSNM